jgi:hypothetical protein
MSRAYNMVDSAKEGFEGFKSLKSMYGWLAIDDA